MESDRYSKIYDYQWKISIHALRMESDEGFNDSLVLSTEISIHALRMESDVLSPNTSRPANKFLSTLSAWRATCSDCRC